MSTRAAEPRFPPIAVVGLSAILPGSSDVGGFWNSVLTGQDLITEVPESHWSVEDYYDPDPARPDRTYGRRGAFLGPVDFDPLAFGLAPNALPATDTSQLLALVAAARVLDDATGGDASALDTERTAVILGASVLELYGTMTSRLQRPVWLSALREAGVPEDVAQSVCERIAARYVPWQTDTFPGLLSNVITGRIANRFDLHGTNHVTDAACASSFAALRTAVNELALGQADLVVTGGVDTLNDITMYMCFSKTPALSAAGDCRPFAASADGTILGEGVAMFALKRLADAERDGDRVYAVLRGVGSSSDGRGSAVYAPTAAGQERALRRAYATAGYGPQTVELVEAHGTATRAGDAAELAGLGRVFGGGPRPDAQWCALGSVKSQLGHTKAAAGAVGLLKAVLALHHKVLPPTIKIDRPHPALAGGEGPFYLNTEARPWIRDDRHPRRASVSSFGFGGTNFHVAAEEYVPAPGAAARPAPRHRRTPTELVMLGAPDSAALLRRIGELSATDTPLAGLARTTQLDFDAAAALRLAVVATDPADLAAKLRRAADALARGEDADAPRDGVFFAAGPPRPGRTAFLFPGQGSQYVGMGAELAMEFPGARAVWDRAASLRLGDAPLARVVFPPPALDEQTRAAQDARLTATQWAQPALAVASLAVLDVLRGVGVRFDCAAGHSFGELAALHAAGAMDSGTLIRAARRRGEVLRDAAGAAGAGGSGMLAVAAPRAEVAEVLADLGEPRVWISGDNSPKQVTVAGEADALARLAPALAAAGIGSRALNTSAGFHTPIMASAKPALAAFWADAEVRAPQLPVYGNADAAVYPGRPAQVRARLVEHLTAPVRFREQIERMYADGVRTFVEVGAGDVLTRLVGANLGGRDHLAVATDRHGHDGVSELQRALGRLAVGGTPVRFGALWEGTAPPWSPRPGRMAVPILGANYGKPSLPRTPAQTPSAHPKSVRNEGLTMEHEQTAHRAGLPARGAANAVAEITRQAAEAHATYSRYMAETHVAFLRMAEVSVTRLAGTADEPETARTGEISVSALQMETAGPAPAPIAARPRAQLTTAPAREAEPVRAANGHHDPHAWTPPARPAPAETPAAPAPPAPAEMPIAPAAPAPAETPAAQAPPVPAAPADDAPPAPLGEPSELAAILLDVVSEKTGFPVAMLELGLELETDLGIDSIKRVEILAALRRQYSGLPEVEAAELGRLRSLGEIVDRLESAAAPAGAK